MYGPYCPGLIVILQALPSEYYLTQISFECRKIPRLSFSSAVKSPFPSAENLRNLRIYDSTHILSVLTLGKSIVRGSYVFMVTLDFCFTL